MRSLIIITGKDRADFSPAELVCWTELSNLGRILQEIQIQGFH